LVLWICVFDTPVAPDCADGVRSRIGNLGVFERLLQSVYTLPESLPHKIREKTHKSVKTVSKSIESYIRKILKNASGQSSY
jgi:hypothetical protein